ncbi:hypothetical protein [Geobacillus sp. JS12]|uniref:hypothetical protein n=1 Tax=Geobacillus sp. JS12 TaxID=1813182 RepID=UPI00078C844A|nr:hypothetical protein [Geobacillus sp. JS12]AMQ20872.1 hypothetical protein A0V43_08140 [Geobacillus sp. JS12]
MGDVIAIGPLLIRTSWMIWFAAGVGGYLFWWAVWTGSSEQRRAIEQLFIDGVSIYILVWKLSPAIADPSLLWRNPLGVLYLPGGSKGVLWGMAASAAMIVFRTYRRNISWHVVANSFIAVYLGAHFIYYLFERQYGKLMSHSSLFFRHPIHLYQLLLSVLVMLWMIGRRKPIERVDGPYWFFAVWGVGQWLIWMIAR